MRSTSSALRGQAALLCIVLFLEWSGAAAAASVAPAPEPCILLKYYGPGTSEARAREKVGPLPALMLKDLNVRWLPPVPPAASQGPPVPFPEPDGASLARIAGLLADAAKKMDGMETADAAGLLGAAEREARRYRFGDAIRPFLADIFLRRGLLLLWEGDRRGAQEMFARSRVIRPDFTPDPALFSPSVREAWALAGDRPAPAAEILVQSIPSGAEVRLDGRTAGKTPCRVRVPTCSPLRLGLASPGYREVEKTGQWLPGDSESVEWVLPRDPAATLGEMLSASPDGKGTGKILGEMAEASSAARVAVLLLEEREGRLRLHVLSFRPGEEDPVPAGRIDWPAAGGGDAGEAAREASKMLRKAGWPAANIDGSIEKSAWYHKWWVWALIGVVGVGAAASLAGGGGGGGDSGGSAGSIDVTF